MEKIVVRNLTKVFPARIGYVGLVVIAILGWLAALLLDATERLLIPWKPRR